MNKEKSLMMASKSSHILGKHSTFEAFMSQKSESLPHSFFFEGSRSKVIFRVTQNPTIVSFALPRNYLALRGCRTSHLRPMVAGGEVGYKPTLHLPMVAFVSACSSVSDYHTRISITFKMKCYGE